MRCIGELMSLDEKFLQWWERSLEEKGYDMDKKQPTFFDPSGKKSLQCL